jgi:dTDP-glucose pyrophosphorylase
MCNKIVIPMAGLGDRFKKAGYKEPKPFIDVLGKPMIQRVVESLKLSGKYIFIAQKEHLDNYDGYNLLNNIVKDPIIIPLEHVTDGAACTVLLAKEHINNNDTLFIANSDQIINYDAATFQLNTNFYDGHILTFPVRNDSKWSYVQYEYNQVIDVAEKIPISDKGNVGLYGFNRGHDFVWAAEQMIRRNTRTNNEYYIAPVYNELIDKEYFISWQDCQEMFACGTPEDLEKTIERLK